MHVVFVFVGVLRFRCLFLQRIKNIRHLVQGRITHVYDAQCTHICTKCVCMYFFDILTVFTICPYQVAKILVFIWLIWYFFLLTDFVDKVIFFHMYTSLHIYVLSSFTFSLFLFFFVSIWTGLVAKSVSFVSINTYLVFHFQTLRTDGSC